MEELGNNKTTHMKTKDQLPPLPEGYVYLGTGGTFLTDLKFFEGARFYDGTTEWKFNVLTGEDDACHYAVPADSAIAKLNAKQEVPKSIGFMIMSMLGEPSKVHDTRESAETEAKRLAEKHPNVVFSVCEIVSRFKGAVTVENLAKKEVAK